MKSKTIISIIIIIMVFTVQVMPIFALTLPLPEGYYFPDPNISTNWLFASGYNSYNTAINSNAYPYIIIYKTNNQNYKTIILMSTQPIYMNINGEDKSLYIPLSPTFGYRKFEWDYQSSSGWIMVGGADPTGSYNAIYSTIQYDTIYELYDSDNPLNSLIMYSNFNLYNQEQTIGYYSTVNSQFNMDGTAKNLSNLEEGQLYPDIDTVYTSTDDFLDLPYSLIYTDSSDNQMRLITSSETLSLNPINDGLDGYDIIEHPYTTHRTYRLDVDEWVLIESSSSINERVIGHLDSLLLIYFSNYNIMDKFGINEIYNTSGNTHDQNGFEDPTPGDVGTGSWLDEIFQAIANALDIKQALASLFVPTEIANTNKLNILKNTVASKLGYQTYLNMLESIESANAVTFTNTLSGSIYGVGAVSATIIDTSWYDNLKPTINNFFYAIFGVYAAFQRLGATGFACPEAAGYNCRW